LIAGKYICVFTDETQSSLGKGVARFIVNSLYTELPDFASNWLFILAGTFVLESKILKATPADRAFLKLVVEKLNDQEVKQILQGTVKGTSVVFPNDVCKDIAKDSQGIPYYVQLFGDKFFILRKKGVVTKSFYSQNRKRVIHDIGKTLFDSRLKDLKRRGLYFDILVSFAKLDKEEGVSVREAAKGIDTDNPGFYVQELESKGYLIRVKRGRYRLVDNLFREWICKHYK